MSFINLLREDQPRTSHAHRIVDNKTMFDNRRELFNRGNGVFLEYNFKNLKSKYNKDLSVTGGVSFDDGEVVFTLDNSSLESQLNTFFPKQNFMIKVLCTLPNDSALTISMGDDTEIVINPYLNTFGGKFNLTDYVQGFPNIGFTDHSSYNDGGENEYTVIYDNTINHEISFFMNDHKLSYTTIEEASSLTIDIKDKLKIVSSKAGVRLNQFELLHKIPEYYTTIVEIDLGDVSLTISHVVSHNTITIELDSFVSSNSEDVYGLYLQTDVGGVIRDAYVTGVRYDLIAGLSWVLDELVADDSYQISYSLFNETHQEWISDSNGDVKNTIIPGVITTEVAPPTAFETKFGTDWTLIKSLAGGSETWFPGNDNLDSDYGGGFTEFLFTSGDLTKWLISDKTEVQGVYADDGATMKWIKRSSTSVDPYQVLWYKRPESEGRPHQPQIMITDFSDIMYLEDSARVYTGQIDPSGMFVYVRTESAAEVQTAFETKFGTGWRVIKELAGGSETWFPGNDNLESDYGDFTEFLFTHGDMAKWMIADRTEVQGEYGENGSALKWIKRSSLSEEPSQATWYKRTEDYRSSDDTNQPVIAITNNYIHYAMYLEQSTTFYTNLISASGMFVYVR